MRFIVRNIFCVFTFVNFIYPVEKIKFYSQFGQDKYIFENFFKDKKDGFFFDIGAFDGVFISNTYFFEKHLNWNGICLEPTIYLFEQLIKSRQCLCLNFGIWKVNGLCDFYEIKFADGENHGWSGLVDSYDEIHKKELLTHDCIIKKIKIQCKRFNDVCKQYKIAKVDYLSIDTEGSELDILETIDFKSIYIDVISVENNFNKSDIKNFLIDKGYGFVIRLGVDDIYRKIK